MTGDSVGEVFVLYVDPNRRGRGFGTAVPELLIRQQAHLGAVDQWVSVLAGKALGIPFYKTRGFEFVEEVTPWDGATAAGGGLTWRMRRQVPRPAPYAPSDQRSGGPVVA